MHQVKRFMQLLIVVGICVFCSTALASEDGKITREERAKVIKLLTETQAETLDALENLSDEQLTFKAAPNKWSVLEVAEHIMLAESLLFGAVQGAIAAKPNPDWEEKTKGKTEFIEKVMPDRSNKAQAPESIVPSAKLTRNELIAKYKEARGRTLKFAEETDLPLKAHTLDHPFPVFGTLNAYQWLIYIPLHNVRHNKQIAEVRSDPNFPKK